MSGSQKSDYRRCDAVNLQRLYTSTLWQKMTPVSISVRRHEDSVCEISAIIQGAKAPRDADVLIPLIIYRCVSVNSGPNVPLRENHTYSREEMKREGITRKLVRPNFIRRVAMLMHDGSGEQATGSRRIAVRQPVRPVSGVQ